jgi:DNA-binding NarL/FixJ family response regulator
MSATAPAALIRVLVVEDNLYTRTGAVALLRAQPSIEVVGEAADGQSALRLFDRVRPDVTIVDLRMPGMDGAQLTRTLCARDAEARVLVLTSYQGDEDIFQALKAGARGYLTKEAPGEELLAGIRALHAGERFLPPAIVERLTNRMFAPELSRRERQVLEELAKGASNRQVAEALGLSEPTVRTYVSSVLGKLGARTRLQAVSLAMARGLLPPPKG